MDFAKLPFRGFDKFKKMEFKYQKQHVEPPNHLYWIGCSDEAWQTLNERISISFGGTTSPTTDAWQLAELLAQRAVIHYGAVVMGGGVTGIDMAAHLGALDEGGSTIAVLAHAAERGLHPLIPKRKVLERGLLARGGLLSEYNDKDVPSNGDRLLQRDRIRTALSDVFIAVECSKDSGTVDAAKRAKIQGKEVYAVDWSRFRETWAEPETSGARQVLTEKIAAPFPCRSVTDIRDKVLLDELAALLDGMPGPGS